MPEGWVLGKFQRVLACSSRGQFVGRGRISESQRKGGGQEVGEASKGAGARGHGRRALFCGSWVTKG